MRNDTWLKVVGIFSVAGAIAAILVVPEVRKFVGLTQETGSQSVSSTNGNRQPEASTTEQRPPAVSDTPSGRIVSNSGLGTKSVESTHNEATSATSSQESPEGSDTSSLGKPQGSGGSFPARRESTLSRESISVEGSLKEGLRFYDEGNYAEALRKFRGVLNQRPDFLDAYYFAGLSYEKMKNPAAALDAYSRCQSGPYAAVSRQHVKKLRGQGY